MPDQLSIKVVGTATLPSTVLDRLRGRRKQSDKRLDFASQLQGCRRELRLRRIRDHHCRPLCSFPPAQPGPNLAELPSGQMP